MSFSKKVEIPGSTHYDIYDTDWNCPRKQQARANTIVDFYKSNFGLASVPKDRQYWSLCAACGNENGIFEGRELHQLLKSGVVKPEQFVGVDKDERIYEDNIHIKGPTWICDDFVSAIEKSIAGKQFRPAIINYDSIHFPMIQSSYFCGLLKLLTYYVQESGVKDFMLVSNFVLQCYRHKRVDNSDITKAILSNISGRIAWDTGIWKMHDFCYVYRGTGKRARTTMGTVVFTLK